MSRKKRLDKVGEGVPQTRKQVEITFKNKKQRDYARLIEHHDITFGIGSTGTGKTFIPALIAVKQMTNSIIDKIVVCRPAVPAGGEDIGFIPGGINEKMDPYLRPVFDAFGKYWSHSTITDHIRSGRIEVVPLAFMRGRTFERAFIIADEMQNASMDNLLMLLTRLGEDSKMVITGDPLQTDRRGDSCLYRAQTILKDIAEIAFCRFTDGDVIRHATVGKIVQVWPTEDRSDPEPETLNGELPRFLINGSGLSLEQ